MRKHARKETGAVSALVGVVAILGPTAALLAQAPIPAGKPASHPGWWYEREVIRRNDPMELSPLWPDDYPSSDDFAVLNQGQLKFLATQAAQELDAHLPGGSGSALKDLTASWLESAPPEVIRDDFAAVNQGQLKTIAQLIYGRLITEQYTTDYPWTSSTGDDSSYSAANVGQAKNLFKFDLLLDTDFDDLPDWWEWAYFGSYNETGSGNYDGDTLTNLQEYQQFSDPTQGDSDGDGALDSTELTAGTNPGFKDHPAVQLYVEMILH